MDNKRISGRWLVGLALVALSAPVWSAAKVALVIGNSQYQASGDSLKNPVNDARAIARRMQALGYDTELLPNATLDQMLDAITRVKSRVDAGGTVFFYYAGHGVQLDNSNYLVPIDAHLATRERVKREAVQLREVMDGLNASPATVRILVLDACRNDPFPKAFRSSTRGLTREDLQDVQGNGMMVLYAARPGEVAEDGNGANGTFTSALLAGLAEPGKELPKLMDDVTSDVQRRTGSRQNRSAIPTQT